MSDLDTLIGQWRAAVLRGSAVVEADADELEAHLREQITDLEAAGLNNDEAFLIAVRRMGDVDQVSAEFAREHSDRLWKQLALTRPNDTSRPEDTGRRSTAIMLAFAALAAILIQVARVLAITPTTTEMGLFGNPTASWFFRDASLFVLPVLAAYFALQKRMPLPRALTLAAVVAAMAVAVNLFPYAAASGTEALVEIHLPVVL